MGNGKNAGKLTREDLQGYVVENIEEAVILSGHVAYFLAMAFFTCSFICASVRPKTSSR